MPRSFPTHVPADAQRRFVSKQRAFGAASSGASSGSSDSGAAEAAIPDAAAAGDGAAPARQQQLCNAELAGRVPPYRMLKGSCPLTSRKVGACAAVGSHGCVCHQLACHCCPACSSTPACCRLLHLCTPAFCGSAHAPHSVTPHLPQPQFPKLTARAVGRLFSDCRSGLQLLGPSACEPAAAPAAAPQPAAADDGQRQEGAEQQEAEQQP